MLMLADALVDLGVNIEQAPEDPVRMLCKNEPEEWEQEARLMIEMTRSNTVVASSSGINQTAAILLILPSGLL